MQALIGSAPEVLGMGPLGLMLESAVKATLVLGGVAVLCRVFASAPAALRHLLWLLGMAAVVVIPVATIYTPWRVEVLPKFLTSQPAPLEVQAPLAAEPARPAAEEAEALGAPPPLPDVDEAVEATAPATTLPVTEPAPATFTWMPPVSVALLLLWGAGAFVVGLRSVRGSLRLRRIVSTAESVTDRRWLALADRVAERTGFDRIRLMWSSSLSVPAAVGLFRPSVLLPLTANGWTESRLEAVLLHEVAHLQRRDLYAQWLSRLACAVYWFHPMVWMAARHMHAEGERACDDMVLRSGVRASDYAEHLLCIARGADELPVPAAALGLTGESDFERRVFAILEPAVRHGAPSPATAAAAALAFACVAIPVAALSALHVGEADAAQVQQQQQQQAQQQVDPRAVAALTELLADSSRSVQIAAIDALGDARATTAVPQLLQLLEDPSSSIRERAARALGDIGDPRAVTALSGVMALDRDRDARQAAVRALGKIGDAVATDFLIQAIRTSPDGSVRHEAVEALGDIGNQAAVAALAELIQSGQRDLADEAFDSLAEIRTQASIDVLIQLTRSPDPRIRREAAQALGGQFR